MHMLYRNKRCLNGDETHWTGVAGHRGVGKVDGGPTAEVLIIALGVHDALHLLKSLFLLGRLLRRSCGGFELFCATAANLA